MLVEVLASTAHASAFLFIDAIDPAGTVNAGVYEQIGRVFAKTKRYEEFLGGMPVEDVAVYYSDDSRFRPEDSGRVSPTPRPTPLPRWGPLRTRLPCPGPCANSSTTTFRSEP